MTTRLKSGESKDSINRLLKTLKNRKARKGLNAAKYCGSVNFKEDGLALQKCWRDEWR